MIDEELYRRATDELDSDERKPDVWARACALASDDHDEARFLYTNLRVEEMLNKDGKQRTFSSSRHRRDADLSDAERLESLDLPDSVEVATASSRTGVSSSEATPLPSFELDSIDTDNLSGVSSVTGTGDLSSNIDAFDDETLSELETLSKSNASTDAAVSGISGKKISAKHLEEPSTNDIVSEVFGASAASARSQILSPEEQRTTELAHKLERQAENMDDADVNNANDTKALEAPPASVQQSTASVRTDYADSTDMLDADSTLDLEGMGDFDDSELDTGIGPSFMVFSRRGVVKAIKRGVSWPALLFTFPWLLSKALFGTAIVYGFLWLVTLAGLYATGTSWLDAGADASLGIKLWTAAFAVLAIVGLLYVPFKYGNRWVAEKLQNRGFEFEASVSASSKRDAVNRLFEPNT